MMKFQTLSREEQEELDLKAEREEGLNQLFAQLDQHLKWMEEGPEEDEPPVFELTEEQEYLVSEQLCSHNATIVFNLMRDYHSDLLKEYWESNELVPQLNKWADQYELALARQIKNGLQEFEAREIEWPEIVAQAGLA